jgi:hypothetical protein
MRLRSALAVVALSALLGACGSPCEDLATRICECDAGGRSRSDCEESLKDQIENGNPGPAGAQQDFCEAKLRTCPDPSDDRTICERLETEEGKVACGLAYPAPASTP